MLTKKQMKHLASVKHSPGMIVRIKLKHFVTYDIMELYAHPKLNIILGPNGTGKSTFLCAVVLGLGGKPSIIGRSSNAADYIKRDRESATIEIELFNPEGRNHVITRKIISKNSSNWFLQGNNVSFKMIEEILAKYNIIINNLCQILPQDRVQDFAKMDKKELLEATQKAVGTGELFNWFQKLKSFRTDLLDGNQDFTSTKNKYDTELQKLKSMEGEVRSYKEKQTILNRIETMKKKEAWLLFEAKNEERSQINAEVEESIKCYENAKKKLKPLLNAIKKVEAVEEQLTLKIQNKETVLQDINKKIKEFIRTESFAKGRITTLKEELDSKLKSHAEKNRNIQALQNKRMTFLEQLPKESESHLITGIYVCDSQIKNFTADLVSLRTEEAEVRHRLGQAVQAINANEHRLSKATSVIEKKLELLTKFRDAHEAYKWLQNHKDEFSGRIYGPMFLELNVTSSNKAKHIERLIPRADLIAFVCENSKDMTKFLSKMKDEKGLKINAVYSNPSEVPAKERYEPKFPLDQISTYGFTNYLIDLIEGPDPILHYLCKIHNLHNIPVGGASINEKVDSIPKELKMYFSSDQVYKVTASRFSNSVTKSVEYVRDAHLLAYSVNSDLIASIQDELTVKKQLLKKVEEEIKELNEKKDKIESENGQTKNKKRELARQLEHLRTSLVRLKMMGEEIEQLEQNSLNPEEEKLATSAEINKCIDSIILSEKEILALLKQSSEIRDDLQLKKKEVEIAAWRVRECQKESRQKEIEAKRAKDNAETKREYLSKVRAETRDLLQKAKEATDGLGIDDPEFANKFRDDFQKYANTLEALAEEIGEQEAMGRHLQNSGSERVFAEYEERKKMLNELEKRLSNMESTRSTLQQQSLELREKWLPTMRDLLKVINSKFEKCFEYLGCCGTVDLDLTDNPEAVENYGLAIKVKFRNEGNLQVLDPFTQSGGERSVSTAIFLLSIQSVINVPFRFVDEINQGMDAFNELRIYYLISCAVSQEKSAQYFLISPKLIESTKISLDTMVHVIYSGKCDPKNNEHDSSTSTGASQVRWSKKKYFRSIGLSSS